MQDFNQKNKTDTMHKISFQSCLHFRTSIIELFQDARSKYRPKNTQDFFIKNS
jgi:hypothetical protein